MPIGELCKHPVIVVEPEHSVRAAAAMMREHHVGALVVVRNDGTRKPVGIVTDRDIAIGVVAVGLDAEVLTVGDIMGPRLVTAPVDQGVLETVRQMRTKGIRRLPLVAHDGVWYARKLVPEPATRSVPSPASTGPPWLRFGTETVHRVVRSGLNE